MRRPAKFESCIVSEIEFERAALERRLKQRYCLVQTDGTQMLQRLLQSAILRIERIHALQ